MLAHLLPKMLWAAMMAASSSGVKGPFLTSGLSWLSHLQCRGEEQQDSRLTNQQAQQTLLEHGAAC